MKASVIIIGNELLYGRIADTNGPWLAKWLDEQGIELAEIQILPDDREVLIQSLKKSWESSDIVITSGGIGPTKDDMTKGILAEFCNKKLNPSDAAAKIVAENYKYYKRDWTRELNDYHVVPDDFIITPNPKGLAPGLFYQENGKALMAAPGVPRELKAMLEEEFKPLIHKFFSDKFNKKERVVIRTARVPEEQIFNELVPDLWDELSKFGLVSSLPQVNGVDIIVTITDGNFSEKEKAIQEYVLKTPLAEKIWQWGDKSLPELIVEEATKKGITIAFAESCTGGLTASRITDIPGSSAIFLGSLVTYSNDAKSNIIGVPQHKIVEHGAVSKETVVEMVEGARDKLGADLCVAFSGIAGPSGGTKEKPVGTLALAWSNGKTTESEIYQFAGDRERLKLRFSEIGLYQLFKMIRDY